jgi:hypothetical protein
VKEKESPTKAWWGGGMEWWMDSNNFDG